MKKTTKLLLSIFTIFFLTVGIISVTYGFSGERDNSHTEQAGSSSVETDSEHLPEGKKEPAHSNDSEDKQSKKDSAGNEMVKEKKDEDAANSINQKKEQSSGEVMDRKPDPVNISKGSDVQSPKEKAISTEKQSTDTGAKKNTSSGMEKEPGTKAPAPNKKPQPAASPKPEKVEEETPVSTATYSIVADSQMGTVLRPVTVEIEDGDTVLDVLISVTRDQGIPMSFRGGTGANAYVEGINNLFEFDRGPGSGWMYRVNGIFPNRGAGVIPLYDGDRIEWLYTVDLGEDIGAELKPFR
jgi:hypothetical protein